jgi:glutamate racemase
MSKKMKILVTDSGIGGLSVAAELYERIKIERHFEQAEIIFFDCRPSADCGYGPLKNNSVRAHVFSKALTAMYGKFAPDVIIIACNTLSSIYGMTEFAQNPPVPVIGIIEDGVARIAELLTAFPEQHMVLLGTPTTVGSGMHKELLNRNGINSERLHYQACPGLPEAISRDAGSREVRGMIREFMDEAGQKVAGKGFAVSLLCTHFGYSLPFFDEAAGKYPEFSNQIINPNSTLVDSFLKNYGQGGADNTDVEIKCYTHSTVPPESQNKMFPLIASLSRDAADAFMKLEYTPGMFQI